MRSRANMMFLVWTAAAVGLLAASPLAQQTAVGVAAGTPKQPSESQGTPEARAAFMEGETLRKQQKFADAAVLYKKAAALDPTFVEAHWQYIWNAQIGDKDRAAAEARLRAEYAAMAAAQPRAAVLHWAIGKLTEQYVDSESHYLRAIELDPGFSRAYQELALIADFRGENAKQIEYLRKAAELNPEDPQYLFYYASAVRDDEALYRRLSLQVVERFPEHERGAQALYWLGLRARETTEKVAFLERLRTAYPPSRFSWSASGMTALFGEYQTTSPDKAVALASEMVAISTGTSVKTWQTLLTLQQHMLMAEQQLREGKAAEAASLLDGTPTYRYVDLTPYRLLRAKARSAAGDTQKAYDELIAIHAAEPQPPILEAARQYGSLLKKSEADLSADIWTVRDAAAKPAAPFTLKDYYEGGKLVSLADYRGRVVLVNFWYPACGPCRGEFPHLQRVAERFKDRGFEILALNIYPDEDAFVVPYMRNNRFLFRPLRTTADWAKDQYGAIGMPSNYLVDHEGRIMFKPGVISDEKALRTFERQVEALLDRAAQVGGR